MTLGQKIREARLSRKMTQRDVSGDIITRNMLSKIENDSATPSVRTLTHIANVLGLPPGTFLEENEREQDGLEAWLSQAEAEQDAGRGAEQLVERAARRMEALNARLALLKARILMKEGSFEEASAVLAAVSAPPENREEAYCAAMEICCREQGDYERAYRYAARRLALVRPETEPLVEKIPPV